MAHFTRELSDAEWFLGRTSGIHTAIRNIDEKTKRAPNESSGAATFAPSSAIILGGAGLNLYGVLRVSAGTPGALVFPGVGKHFKFGDDDYFKLATVHFRQSVQSMMHGVVGGLIPREFRAMSDSANMRAFGLRKGARFRIPLTKLPDGQRLQTVITAVDGEAKGRLIRILPDGTVVPIVVANETDQQGWTPPSTGAIEIDCSSPSPGLLIDTSTAEYFFEVEDFEGGTEVRPIILEVNHYDMRFQ